MESKNIAISTSSCDLVVGDLEEANEIGNAPHLIVVEDDTYQEFMAEVIALPLKKRKNWKGHTLSQKGTRTRCVYRHDHIFSYSEDNHAWLQVVPMSFAARTLEKGIAVPQNAVGEAMIKGVDSCISVFIETMDATYTGNHRRNHRIVVPSRPDGIKA